MNALALRGAAAAAAALLLPLAAPPAAAQLRPLDPFEWRLLDPTHPPIHVELGGAGFTGQRAALAGVEGRLVEAGSFRAFWRTGRVTIEAGGTLQRFFWDGERFAPPFDEVDPELSGKRRDAGDYRIATVVRLTPETAPAAAILRFGTRLPTTDNRTGLERDMTDFFALLGGALRQGPLLLALESGVSINGTRYPDFEQKDVMPYALVAEWTSGFVEPRLVVVGDLLGPSRRELRGNEPHGEVRLGLRSGGRRWLRAEVIRGYREFSPDWGVSLVVGGTW
jgi:hypothetical protein